MKTKRMSAFGEDGGFVLGVGALNIDMAELPTDEDEAQPMALYPPFPYVICKQE